MRHRWVPVPKELDDRDNNPAQFRCIQCGKAIVGDVPDYTEECTAVPLEFPA